MAVTWTDFNNGDSLLVVRNKINSFNSDIANAVTANTGNINTLTTDMLNVKHGLNLKAKPGVNVDLLTSYGYYYVDTNLPGGATEGELRVGYNVDNATNIIQEFISTTTPYTYRRQSFDSGTNWTAWQETAQTVLNKSTEELVGKYYYSKFQGNSTTSKVYSPLGSLTVPKPPSGVYEYKFSMTWTYSTTNRSAYFRVSYDGGASWFEIRKEAKDTTDLYPIYYAFPHVFTQTGNDDIELLVEYRTEANGDVLNVLYLDLVVERKA